MKQNEKIENTVLDLKAAHYPGTNPDVNHHILDQGIETDTIQVPIQDNIEQNIVNQYQNKNHKIV